MTAHLTAQLIERMRRNAAVDTVDDPRRSIRAAHNYAVYAGRRNDFREAIRIAELALARTLEYGWRWGEGGAWQALGNLASFVENGPAAMTYYRRAAATLLEAGNRVWAAYAFANLANQMVDEQRFDEALVLIREAQKHATGHLGYYAGVIGMHADLLIARVLRAMGQHDEARRTLAEGVAIVEAARANMTGDALRRAGYFGRYVDIYYELADLLVEENEPREALAIAELVRARAVTDALRFECKDMRRRDRRRTRDRG